MSAPEGNKNACKDVDELAVLIPLYIEHRAGGLSKKSFEHCDYETIEKYINSNIDFYPLKKELEKAERIGRKYWEEVGKKITTGDLKGNPATWIFTMKNKYPDEWKDKSEIDANINFPSMPTVIIKTKKNGSCD